ncbi:MAG: hypothetical protein ACLUUO_14495 [Sellimonas intestinalis]
MEGKETPSWRMARYILEAGIVLSPSHRERSWAMMQLSGGEGDSRSRAAVLIKNKHTVLSAG